MPDLMDTQVTPFGYPPDLSHIKADTIILEAQFAFAQNTMMPNAALATVAAAEHLYGTDSPV